MGSQEAHGIHIDLDTNRLAGPDPRQPVAQDGLEGAIARALDQEAAAMAAA